VSRFDCNLSNAFTRSSNIALRKRNNTLLLEPCRSTLLSVDFEFLYSSLTCFNALTDSRRYEVVSLKVSNRAFESIDYHVETLYTSHDCRKFDVEGSEILVESRKTLQDLEAKRDDTNGSARVDHCDNPGTSIISSMKKI
jgi:hypothetical protein